MDAARMRPGGWGSDWMLADSAFGTGGRAALFQGQHVAIVARESQVLINGEVTAKATKNQGLELIAISNMIVALSLSTVFMVPLK